MTDRAAALIEALRLAPHPEGGHYREVFRSADVVEPRDGRGPRSALTTIYYLLRAGERSRWHRVASDEVWHLYEGDGLELWLAAPDGSALTRVRLGAASPSPSGESRAGGGQASGSGGRGEAPGEWRPGFAGPERKGACPPLVTARVEVVPAGVWQAARPLGAYALAGCTVGPGFEFGDFTLLADDAASRARLCERWPEAADLV